MLKRTEIETTRATIHVLYNHLMQRAEKSSTLLTITDVLLQVYQKLETSHYPEVLINQLVNYIYIVGFDAKLQFGASDEKLLGALRETAKKAGINSKYRADYADKSQFYGLNEEIPRR